MCCDSSMLGSVIRCVCADFLTSTQQKKESVSESILHIQKNSHKAGCHDSIESISLGVLNLRKVAEDRISVGG